MSGWDDEIRQQPKPPQSRQDNQRLNNNKGQAQQNNKQQPAEQKSVLAQKPAQQEGPKRFQFFNSNKGKATGEKQQAEEQKVDSTEIKKVENVQILKQINSIQIESKEAVVFTKAKEQEEQEQPPCEQANYDIPHKILVRSKAGIYDTSCFATSMVKQLKIFNGSSDFMKLSNDEKHILITCDSIVRVISTTDYKVISQKQFISVCHTSLSKSNKFIQVFDRIDNNKFIVGLFSFPDFNLIREFNEKRYIKENAPYLKFNVDESNGFYYNYTTGFVEIYSTLNFQNITKQIEMQNIDFFQISPQHEYLVGCFLEHMVGYEKTQARIQCYNVEKDRREKVKNIEKAQEINLKWSPDGTHVIIVTQTTHDTSGKTYYGQTGLLLFSFGSKKLQQIPTIEGPVIDIAWNPLGETFIVIVGYMPARPILYNIRCDPLFSFGSMHRNTIRFQPQGRFVLFGGFGNIAGDVDIWELNSLEKLTKFNAATSTSIDWSVDGKYIISGVLNSKLKVDNNFKVFSWNGELVNTCSFKHTELYEVTWKPNQIYKDTSLIPEKDIAELLTKQRKQFHKEKNTQAPKFGGGNFAAMLRNDKEGEEGPKKITGNEEWLLKARNEAKVEAKKVKKEKEE